MLSNVNSTIMRILPREALDLARDRGLDLRELLIPPGIPELVDDDEGDDEALQQEAEDAQWNVLDRHHLRGLVLEEAGRGKSGVGFGLPGERQKCL